MQILYNIRPRQSGKTTICFEMWFKNPKDTLLLMHSETYRENMHRLQTTEFFHNIFIIDQINDNSFIGVRFTDVIIDEYDMLTRNKRKIIFDFIMRNPINNIYVYTTQYDIILFEFYHVVKLLRKRHNLRNIIRFITLLYPEMKKNFEINNEIDYYYYSLLCHENTILYGKPRFTRMKEYLKVISNLHFI
jgi:hypothetical protein